MGGRQSSRHGGQAHFHRHFGILLSRLARNVLSPDFKKLKIHELQFLAEFFDFCEINSSFYRPVNPETARKWCQYVSNNEEFQFTAKLTEVFTHAPGRGNKKSSSPRKPSVTRARTLMLRRRDSSRLRAREAADMNAAWVRRRTSTIQLWTVADPYLANFHQLDFKVERGRG